MKSWSTTADFIIRSVVTAALTLYLTWTTVHFALQGSSPPDWLMTTTAVAWAFYFGNHFVQNGKVLDAAKIVTQMQTATEQVVTNTQAIANLQNGGSTPVVPPDQPAA